MTEVMVNLFRLHLFHFSNIYLKSCHFGMREEGLYTTLLPYLAWGEKRWLKRNRPTDRHLSISSKRFLSQAPARTRKYVLTAALRAAARPLLGLGSGQMAARARGEEAAAAGEGQPLPHGDVGADAADAGNRRTNCTSAVQIHQIRPHQRRVTASF